MSDSCKTCGVGFRLPSGRCDHCDALVPSTKKRYEIHRDGVLFGGFTAGEVSRFDGQPMDDELMLREFRSCIAAWERYAEGNRFQWELRIICAKPNTQ